MFPPPYASFHYNMRSGVSGYLDWYLGSPFLKITLIHFLHVCKTEFTSWIQIIQRTGFSFYCHVVLVLIFDTRFIFPQIFLFISKV